MNVAGKPDAEERDSEWAPELTAPAHVMRMPSWGEQGPAPGVGGRIIRFPDPKGRYLNSLGM